MSIDQIEELKSIIMGFRVSELTQLLTFCNQRKFGRKPVLQSRALDLLKNNNLTQKVQFKIRELSLQQNGGIIPSHNHSNKTIPEIPLIQDSSSNECTITEPEMMSHSIGFNSNLKSHVHDYYTSMPKLDLGNLNCNVGLMPTVRFKPIPFDDLLYTIIQPTALHSLPISKQRFNSYDCHFRLKAEEANEISMTREFKNNKFEFSSQIHLRFCQIDTKSQDDLLPLNLNVKLNNKSIPLPSIIQNNKPNVESKRQSKPIDLTPFCKISPVSNNQLNITWTNDINQKNFCFTVCLIKKLTSSQLLDKLNLKGATDPLDTQKLIISKLTDTDNEISTTSLKCNLNCPLGKMRLRIPVRSTICNHIQCFDAELYLQMNEKKPSWLCPVCDKKAEYWTLFIDGLFTQILKEAPADSNEIEFSDDGSWKVVQNLNKTVTLTPQRRKIEEDTSSIKKSKTEEEEEIIELSSDSEDDNNENLNQCSSINMTKISTFGDNHASKSINSLNSYLQTPFNQFSTSLNTISQSSLDNRSQSRGLITRYFKKLDKKQNYLEKTSHAPSFGNTYNVNHLTNNNFPMGSSNINRNSEPNVISID